MSPKPTPGWAILWIASLVTSSLGWQTAAQKPSTGSSTSSVTSKSSNADQLASSFGCPRACFCNAPSRIVYCSRRGLGSIPDGISTDSLQLNLNGNAFDSPLIVRRNLTRYVHLEHLYLSECGLEAIQVGAFADLVDLRWLDLSNNRLRSIEPNTFDGLRLQHLFVNGNRNVRIGPDSFAGLETVGLYLQDCALPALDPSTLDRLKATLRYLWLNGNELERIDVRLEVLFSGLSHLRLGSNPLRCDCAAGWLKRLFDRSPDVFKGAVPPTCLTPRSLKGRHFSELADNELRCQVQITICCC